MKGIIKRREMIRMRFRVYPGTSPGRWSVVFALGFFALYYARKLVMKPEFHTGGEGFFGNMPAALIMIAAFLVGSLAFFAFLKSLFKKEFSLIAFVCGAFGLLLILFAAGEVLYPH
jgi:cytochrome bd-type quinol oxidase subunit 2